MRQARKVGQNLKMKNKQSIHFAAEFLERAARANSDSGDFKNIKLGTRAVRLINNSKSYFGGLIRDAYIETNEINPTFDFYVWDSSFPDKLPDINWASAFIESNKPIPFILTDPFRILFDRGQGMIFVYNTQTKIGAVWMRDHSQVDVRCCVAPFRVILSWMADDFNGEIVHASAVQLAGKGALISGSSGSGKSSLAIFGAMNGDKILSDDAVLVENGIAHAIYSRAKISHDNPVLEIQKLKTFELKDSPDGKRILPLVTLGDNFITEMKIDLFVFPVIVHMTHIEPVSSEIAKIFFIEQSLRELFDGQVANQSRHMQLLKTFPSFRMALSGNILRDYSCLRNLVVAIS